MRCLADKKAWRHCFFSSVDSSHPSDPYRGLPKWGTVLKATTPLIEFNPPSTFISLSIASLGKDSGQNEKKRQNKKVVFMSNFLGKRASVVSSFISLPSSFFFVCIKKQIMCIVMTKKIYN